MKTVSVMREAPKKSHLKFDYDKKFKCFKLSKVLPAGMLFLFDFGSIPHTKGGDGDPLDVVSVSEFGSFTGCTMDCRMIGNMLANRQKTMQQKTRNDRFFIIQVESAEHKEVMEVSPSPRQIVDQVKEFY